MTDTNPHIEPVRVYVGTDRSQWIGVKVLEHSIRRHTDLPVEVNPMMNLPIRPPRDPAQDQRTGFSFSRFCIPKLAGYRGKAVYMDADMLVFQDIAELWNLPFDGAKVLIQEELTSDQADTAGKRGAPEKRVKQCSVMLLDCEKLDWDVEEIVQGLDDRKYDYAGLMYQLCILNEDEIGYGIPFRWNSLEHYDESTCLIHYTDMRTQPWVNSLNSLGYLWVSELRLALESGFITRDTLEDEIRRGYARPSLLQEVESPASGALQRRTRWLSDRLKGFRPHRVAYRERNEHLSRLRQRAEFAG